MQSSRTPRYSTTTHLSSNFSFFSPPSRLPSRKRAACKTMKGAPKERDSNFEGDYIAVSQGTAWIPTHQQVSGGPEDLPSTRFYPGTPLQNALHPTLDTVSASACGLRNRKRQTVTLHTPRGTSPVAGDHPPFTAKLLLGFSFVSTMRGGKYVKHHSRVWTHNENSNIRKSA